METQRQRVELTRVVLAKPQSIETESLAGMLKTAVNRYCVHVERQQYLFVDAFEDIQKQDGLEQLAAVKVIDCEPVDIGILTSHTEVRIINSVEEKRRVSRSRGDSFDSKEVSGMDSFHSAVESMSCPCLLKPSRIYGLTKKMKDHLKDQRIKADDCHVVGLSEMTLHKLSLEEGSWIVISASTEVGELQGVAEEPRAGYIAQACQDPGPYGTAIMQEEAASKHFVQVFCIQGFLPNRDQAGKRWPSRSTKAMMAGMSLDGLLLDDVIYLNPYLYFNLTTDYPAILDDFKVLVEKPETIVSRGAYIDILANFLKTQFSH
jgi:hypothetical protein